MQLSWVWKIKLDVKPEETSLSKDKPNNGINALEENCLQLEMGEW